MERRTFPIELALATLIVALAMLSLASGLRACRRAPRSPPFFPAKARPASPRDIRLPRTLLAALIGATLGLSGAALQGLLRNPLAEPALFGAPQAAAAGRRARHRVRLCAGDVVRGAGRRHSWCDALDRGPRRDRGPRASLTVTLLAGLALASFAGAATALILNLAPNPSSRSKSHSGCSAHWKTVPAIIC